MAQHLVLAFAAAPLLVLGSPLALGLRATRARRALRAAWLAPAGRRLGSRSRRSWRSASCRRSTTRPPAIRSLHVAEHAAWLAAAVLFWRVVLGADPVPHRPGPLGRLLYLLLFSAPMGATGAVAHVEQRARGTRATRWPTSATRACSCSSAAAWRWRPSRWPSAWAAILREQRRQVAYERGGGRGEATAVARCGARSSSWPCAARAMAAWSAAAGGRRSPRRSGPTRARSWPAAACSSPRGAPPATARTLRGARSRGPPLRGAGARGGRLLPLDRAHAAGRPDRRAASARSPPYPRADIGALVAYVGSLRRARPSRASTPPRGDLAAGLANVHRALRRAATRSSARGGIVTGAAVARPATTRRRRQLAEAVRVGPVPDAELRRAPARPGARWTRSPATSQSTPRTRTTAAAGASATSGRSPRGWSRGCPARCWSPCSGSARLIGSRGRRR